mmetsp:Transcript_69629/g.109866  ORF Transcript_69629/g.109866 Transcript_69629/m.109866 type:complete len:206 (-) Transcript_69629:747-1364(-)
MAGPNQLSATKYSAQRSAIQTWKLNPSARVKYHKGAAARLEAAQNQAAERSPKPLDRKASAATPPLMEDKLPATPLIRELTKANCSTFSGKLARIAEGSQTKMAKPALNRKALASSSHRAPLGSTACMELSQTLAVAWGSDAKRLDKSMSSLGQVARLEIACFSSCLLRAGNDAARLATPNITQAVRQPSCSSTKATSEAMAPPR